MKPFNVLASMLHLRFMHIDVVLPENDPQGSKHVGGLLL